MASQVLLILLFALAYATHEYCNLNVAKVVNTKYVRPDNGTNSSCPGLPCETLDYYASVSHYYNNTHFILMPGLHTLSTNFTLRYLENIAFIGENVAREKNEKSFFHIDIRCNTTVGFIFEQVKLVTIGNLSISHCGQNVSKEVFNCSKNLPCQAAVAFKTVHTLTMMSVNIYSSYGYGFAAEGLYGNSTIRECIFANNAGIEKQLVGGNFIVQYEHCPEEYTH